MNSQTLSQMAKDYYEEQKKLHPEDDSYAEKYRWPAIAGIMSAQAAQLIREAAHIKVSDTDSVGIIGYAITIYAESRPDQIKGSIQFTPWQLRQLVRQLVEEDNDIKDWSCVDLSDWVED